MAVGRDALCCIPVACSGLSPSQEGPEGKGAGSKHPCPGTRACRGRQEGCPGKGSPLGADTEVGRPPRACVLLLGHQPVTFSAVPASQDTPWQGLEQKRVLHVPSPSSPAQTTSTCASKTPFLLTLSCLKDARGWLSHEDHLRTARALSSRPQHCAFLHFCTWQRLLQKGFKRCIGPGTSLLLLSVVAFVQPACPTSCSHLNHRDFLSL